MGIRDRARRRIRELIGRNSGQKKTAAASSGSNQPSVKADKAVLSQQTDGPSPSDSQEKALHFVPSNSTTDIKNTPTEMTSIDEQSLKSTANQSTNEPSSPQPSFQVTSQHASEYESDYVSNDAPTRLSHHAAAVDSGTSFQVTVDIPDGETLQFDCQEGEFILDAADRSGLELPYSCRSGGCLCCAARVISGQIEQAEQYVLEDDHLDQGFVLLCCCTIQSDSHFIAHQEDNID